MPFAIPDELLALLRERRAAQRAQARATPEQVAPRTTNFIDSVRELFSARGGDAKVAAESYVGAMNKWQTEVEDKHDAFLLDPGMGPMVYLTSDGRILEDARGWDGDTVTEVIGDRAIGALVVGAKKTGIAALLGLIPVPPPGAGTCATCDGSRWAEPCEGFGTKLVCQRCGGRGWTSAGGVGSVGPQ